MTEKILTIAIPCYNSQDYVRRALDSVVPAGERLEVLVVDDGSTDGTAAIAKEYEEKYPEIIKPIIHDLKVDLGKKRQLVIDKTEDINNKSKENSSLRKELSPLIDELRNENLKSTEVQANYTFYLNKLDNINDYLLSYVRQESSKDIENKIEDISKKLKDI